MSGRVFRDPLAQAVLRHVAEAKGKDDPFGSLADAILKGEATLHDVGHSTWYGEGLVKAIDTALEAQAALPAEQRAMIERDAERLRAPGQPTDSADDRENT
ncbi:hypothetical protein [Actinoplanes sp. NBRC 101535]|uniref:hypothetical protein n=1 Tax=Actinoplanes sp. NBRC 101535 TaxID=3032196 RepID=UPI0024A2F479|nr:hypothetical protein [Actinoplanes sp. NBRC 101535]GLY05002.1 hypothetical protein Acsp01_53810 [Actinoplanes sp. NBRC 101535]